MNILYEEDGEFKVGNILADHITSLQVENIHGKRSKVKSANVMLRFSVPDPATFMTQAAEIAADIDIDFLWQASPTGEFDFHTLAQDYFGHTPSPLEAAGTLIRLHGSPMYFYRKGKGRYKAAPAEALRAALASVEKKRLLAEQQAYYTQELSQFRLPAGLADKLPTLLYKPDKASIEFKALEAACAATHLSAAHLLMRCGALPSPYNYHLNQFLFEYFPKGRDFPDVTIGDLPELPLADVAAFSIDDASTTEIDDAFSVRKTDTGWRIGIHIAAPALGIAPGSPIDCIARQRLSTVYMPGDKITMLPGHVIETFTLSEHRLCPALSLYINVNEALTITGHESRVERLYIAANLRHDTLEPLFNEATLAAGKLDYDYAQELRLLWEFAQQLEAARGKPADNSTQAIDYTFHIENDRVTIGIRKRGSPIDKVVSELMILANHTWGKLLEDNHIAGIYRTQSNGKVRMSTLAAPHQGLGVAHYAWSSSPLRRYVDLVNQRQLLSLLRSAPPAYGRNDATLFAILRDFDTAYTAYAEFQRKMERYWCLRWLLQEDVKTIGAKVLRENIVKLDDLPLTGRVHTLPEIAPDTRLTLEIDSIDLLDLEFRAHHLQIGEAAP